MDGSGEAIREEDLKLIFKRFCRLDGARSRGGYGLGLAIAQGIVEAHGGKIWAESSGGVNTFSVRYTGSNGSRASEMRRLKSTGSRAVSGKPASTRAEYKLRFQILEPPNGQGYAFVDISSEAGTIAVRRWSK